MSSPHLLWSNSVDSRLIPHVSRVQPVTEDANAMACVRGQTRAPRKGKYTRLPDPQSTRARTHYVPQCYVHSTIEYPHGFLTYEASFSPIRVRTFAILSVFTFFLTRGAFRSRRRGQQHSPTHTRAHEHTPFSLKTRGHWYLREHFA